MIGFRVQGLGLVETEGIYHTGIIFPYSLRTLVSQKL